MWFTLILTRLCCAQQIHLAFSGLTELKNPNGAIVSWQTVDDTTTTRVKYGTDASSLSQEASGFSDSYYSTFDHHVTLANLEPDTQYFYQCGDDEAGWSEVLSFRTAPGDDKASEASFTIGVIGDMGVWNGQDSIDLLNKMGSEGSFDWVWHVGDIAYADDSFVHAGQVFKFYYEETYNQYMNLVQPFTSTHQYMVLPGNHEAECHSPACQVDVEKLEALGNFSAYNSRFLMPSATSNGNSNMWYSFNYGPVHFVSIDTETNYDGAPNDHYTWHGGNGDFWGDQVAWLEADLAQAAQERDVRPWIFVGGHRPIYSAKHADGDGNPNGFSAQMQSVFESLFHEYGVDMYFAGHLHSYERQYPVYDGTNVETDYENPSYTTYIISGGAGCDEGNSDYDDDAEVPSWNVYIDHTHYGVGVLDVSPQELTWRYLDSATGDVLDEMTLTKTSA